MRFVAVALVLAACTANPKHRVDPATAREATFDVAYAETIDDAPATHLAVGGTMHVRVPDGQVTAAYASGPFVITGSSFDTFAVVATGAGTGEIEIETVTGYAHFTVTAAPIAQVGLVFDAADQRRATVTLLDAHGKRLVDANLRIAPGSAPVSFLRGQWDRIEFETLPPGDVLVKTDLMAATKAIVDKVTHSHSIARR